jgi:hypothetical protein
MVDNHAALAARGYPPADIDAPEAAELIDDMKLWTRAHPA